MNIQLPYQWIKEYVRTKLPPEEFAAKLSLSGPSVDRWHRMDEGLDGVVVGEILDFKKHPHADKLHVAHVDIGKKKPIQLIFGQMVVMKVGDKVPVAVAPCTLPGGRKIDKAKMRGEISEGMLCLDQEMGLLKDGVSLRYFDASVINGTPVVKALELDDTIFDIEVTSNRPDAFSAVGIAREAAAILGAPFLWKPVTTNHKPQTTNSVDIRIEAPKLCSRYQAAVVTNVQVKPSPWWMQKRLAAAGIRPISNIVDITNYVMLEQGQPMHAFDADTLYDADRTRIGAGCSRKQIIIRTARQGEKLKALDGNQYKLDPSMLVIADAWRPIAIAGVMGGEKTGVTKDTTTIIFEAATFDPVSVRRTARALNLHSDSSLRFEKGLSTEATTPAIARAVELAQQIAGGTPASSLLDRRAHPYKPLSFAWDPKATNRALGVEIPTQRAKQMLSSFGFSVRSSGKKFRVAVPYWRDHDIEASQDLDEEVGRMYGYHNVPSKLPDSELADWPGQPELEWEDQLREAFRGAGFTETYSNSFVSRQLLELAGWDAPVVALQNPLTEDLAVMRPVVLPSVFQIVAENEPREAEGAIFEIANNYIPQKGELPKETLSAVGAVWSDATGGEQFYRVKGMLEHLIRRWNLAVSFGDAMQGWSEKILHPARAAGLRGATGFVGELHPTVCERFGIRRRVAVFAFRVAEFMQTARGMRYEPIPQFPEVRRDISFVIPERTTHGEIVKVFAGVPLLHEHELFDVYRGKGVPAGKKSMAFHLSFGDPARTLTSDEIDRVFDNLARNLKRTLGAEVRSV